MNNASYDISRIVLIACLLYNILIELKRKERKMKKLPDPIRNRIVKKYLIDKKSQTQLSHEYGISQSTISMKIKYFMYEILAMNKDEAILKYGLTDDEYSIIISAANERFNNH